jgi:HlyD family secretion protein
MKKKGLIIAVVILVIAAATVVLVRYMGNRGQDGTILLSGNVEITEANIGFKISGRIVDLLVDEGQKVHKGEVLARMDTAELGSVVAQYRASLAEAQTRLSELQAGSRRQEIEQAKSNVNLQEAELARTAKDFARAEMLFKNGAIPAAQFDTAKAALETRQALHRSAQEQLSLVGEGPRREEITIASHRVEQAMAALRVAGEKLRETTIYSPMEGVVLKKNAEAGETVSQGVPVFTVGDLARPWIKVYIKESMLGLVKLGEQVMVTTDSFPGKTYEGVITFISPEAEFTPKTIQTKEERVKLVFGIKVSLTNIGEELKPGMPADVRITVKQQGPVS